MTLIDVLRGLLLSLRRHLGGIGAAGHAPWTQLFALDVIFGSIRLNAVWLRFSGHADLHRDNLGGKRLPAGVVPGKEIFERNVRPAEAY